MDANSIEKQHRLDRRAWEQGKQRERRVCAIYGKGDCAHLRIGGLVETSWLAKQKRGDRLTGRDKREKREALHDASQNGYLERLIGFLRDEDWAFRLEAARALGQLPEWKAKPAVRPLIRALEDPHSKNAHRRLGKNRGPQTTYPVRDAAAASLARIGTPAALRAARPHCAES